MRRSQSFLRSRALVRPLTPVSEADSDTTKTTDSTSNHDSSIPTTPSGSNSTSSQTRSLHRILNFSRPWPARASSSKAAQDSSSTATSSTVSAPTIDSSTTRHEYFEQPAYPGLAVFELTHEDVNDRKRRKNVNTGGDFGAASAEFEWDTHLKDMKPLQRRLAKTTEHTTQLHLIGSQSNLDRPSSSSNSSAQGKAKGSVKHDLEEADWDGEDAKSHHTVSEAGDDYDESFAQSMTSWTSSGHGVGHLKDKQLKKLRKKGISPALYLEMKAARVGRKKWINPLVGNTYLS